MTRGASDDPDAPRLVAGLMSGTSADGIDAVLIEVWDDPARPAPVMPADSPERHAPPAWIPSNRHVRLLVHHHVPFEPEFRARILALAEPRGCPLVEVACLNAEIGRRLADAVLVATERAGMAIRNVRVIGSPGLTAAHVPGAEAAGRGSGTLCLGDGDVIAALTGAPVLSDMRAADRALGGQGAPLVPWADAVLLRPRAAALGSPIAALNLGGIANLTIVPPHGDPIAFDTGPGNMLLDQWIERLTGGRECFDAAGCHARTGRINAEFLQALLAEDEFIRRPPPKSTGRERYGKRFLERHEAPLERLGLADALATLAAFTVEAVVIGLEALQNVRPAELVVSGGGARNEALMSGLAERLAPMPVQGSQAALGLDPQAREAIAFALMADASLRGEPASVPSVTGARAQAVLGKLSRPPVHFLGS